MPSLSKPYEAYERPGLVVSYKMSASKIHKGALVGLNASGFLVPLSPATASLRFVGIANETIDNSGGTAGSKSMNVTKSGSFVFRAIAAPALTDLGLVAYAHSDWESTPLSGPLANAYPIGTIVALETTSTGEQGVRVRIDNHTINPQHGTYPQ